MGASVRALLAALVVAVPAAPVWAQAGCEPSSTATAVHDARPDARIDQTRAAVKRIARLIRTHYFDAGKAARIASGLIADARAGLFDCHADARDLAYVLTTRLATEDRHFAVSWSPAGDGMATRVAALVPVDTARVNHGFVESAVLPGGVGYLKLDLFAHFEGPNSPQQAAADAALRFVANTPSLIIDLRDNGGGSPNMVGYLVQQFVAAPADVASVFHNRRGPDGFELSPAEASLPKRLESPLFILVSARTASSAEALAYTLQAAGRALVVGEQTGGAANPGTLRQTEDGFSIFISSGTPVNPITKTNWEGRGVTPDVQVPQDEALRVAQIMALEAEGQSLPAEAVLVLETLKADAERRAPDLRLAGRYGDLAIIDSAGAMRLVQGRRPARTIVPLDENRFSLSEDPSARYAMERRPETGAVMALIRRLPGGGEVRYPRMMEASASLP